MLVNGAMCYTGLSLKEKEASQTALIENENFVTCSCCYCVSHSRQVLSACSSAIKISLPCGTALFSEEREQEIV